MNLRRASALLALIALVSAACGDSASTTTGGSADGAQAATAAPTTTAVPPTSTTLATTTTTRPPAGLPDPAAIGNCDELVDAGLASVQYALDELGSMSLEELAALGDQLPPAIEELNELGIAMEDRGTELGCDPDAIEAGLIARVDELEARGPLGELILQGLKEAALDDTGSAAAPGDPPTGVEYFDVADASHTEDPVEYLQDPPVGGPHHPQWLNCGFYSEPVPNEHAVHSLEHGVVWITYDVGFATGVELAALRDFATEDKVLVSPYPGLFEFPVVASVWGAQMRFASALDPELRQFIDALKDVTAPEPGAPCEGGVGTPDG